MTNTISPAYTGETTRASYEAAQGMALAEEMRRDPTVFLMGQDMASGGFFGGTRGLVEEFGFSAENLPPADMTTEQLCTGDLEALQ